MYPQEAGEGDCGGPLGYVGCQNQKTLGKAYFIEDIHRPHISAAHPADINPPPAAGNVGRWDGAEQIGAYYSQSDKNAIHSLTPSG